MLNKFKAARQKKQPEDETTAYYTFTKTGELIRLDEQAVQAILAAEREAQKKLVG